MARINAQRRGNAVDVPTLEQVASMSPHQVCDALKTAASGLRDDDARQRLAAQGDNRVDAPIEASPAVRLMRPFANWITLILLGAAILALLSDSAALGLAILVIAVLNGIFTTWQEYLAERSIAALRQVIPETTDVRRDGIPRAIASSDLVAGDVVPLRPGMILAADVYILTGDGLRARQAILTGNAAPVSKFAGALADPTLAPTDRPNVVLAGCEVVEGSGLAVVIATGMQSMLGQIAGATSALRKEPSPLSRALGTLAGQISRFAIGAGIGAFVLTTAGQHLSIRDGIIFAIGMIVAFVPEGLLPTVTIALAIARRRLQRQRVLVRRLIGVEALGSATVVCLDRTDNLTTGALVASDLLAGDRQYRSTGDGYAPVGTLLRDGAPIDPRGEPDLVAMLAAATRGANARLRAPDPDHSAWHVIGEPLEGALLAVAARAGVALHDDHMAFTRLATFPFDGRRQLASVVVAGADGVPHVIARGNAHAVVPLCTAVRVGGMTLELDVQRRDRLHQLIDQHAGAGLRVVAIATRQLPAREDAIGWRMRDVEHTLELLGIVAVQEPPQPDVARLVAGCRRAGIRVVIVTGGYGLSAEMSARRAGIITAPRVQLVVGSELETMNNGTLGLTVAPGEEVVFAQLDSEQKRRIVAAFQARGEIVAFLGDSVSDAPALKQADIGVALSASGTTVALAAADIVLDAAHPGGLLLAIREGRGVFANIQKFATYLFTHNAAEAFVIVAGVVFQLPLPLTVLQVLAIDLGTELLPALALSAEVQEPGMLDEPPRARSKPLLERAMLWRVFAWLGIVQGGLALGAYFMGQWSGGWQPGRALIADGPVYLQSTTLAYIAIVLAQVGNVFACRTRYVPVHRIGLFGNRALVGAVVLATAAMLALVYIEPLATLFGFVPPAPQHWPVLATFPVIMFAAHEAVKAWEVRRR